MVQRAPIPTDFSNVSFYANSIDPHALIEEPVWRAPSIFNKSMRAIEVVARYIVFEPQREEAEKILATVEDAGIEFPEFALGDFLGAIAIFEGLEEALYIDRLLNGFERMVQGYMQMVLRGKYDLHLERDQRVPQEAIFDSMFTFVDSLPESDKKNRMLMKLHRDVAGHFERAGNYTLAAEHYYMAAGYAAATRDVAMVSCLRNAREAIHAISIAGGDADVEEIQQWMGKTIVLMRLELLEKIADHSGNFILVEGMEKRDPLSYNNNPETGGRVFSFHYLTLLEEYVDMLYRAGRFEEAGQVYELLLNNTTHDILGPPPKRKIHLSVVKRRTFFLNQQSLCYEELGSNELAADLQAEIANIYLEVLRHYHNPNARSTYFKACCAPL